MKIAWHDDKPLEGQLRCLQVPYDKLLVPTARFNPEEGLRRQVRLATGGRLNDDWVFQYAEAMTKPGASFPMVLAQKLARDSYFTWGGNHRLAAALLADVEEIGCYLVNIKDPRIIAILPRIVNVTVGHGLSREELVINALYLVEEHNVPVKDAASLFGLRAEWVSGVRRAEDARKKLAELGVNPGLMPKALVSELARLPLADVMKDTAELIVRHKAKGAEALQIVADVRSQETAAQMKAELGRWDKIFEDRKRPRRGKVAIPYREVMRLRFIKAMQTFAKVLDQCETLEQAQIVDAADLQVVRPGLKKIAARCEAYLGHGPNGKF